MIILSHFGGVLLDLHLNRRIVASTASKFSSLYTKHLAELDTDGNKIDRDLIPWNWSLTFLATEMTARTTLEISTGLKWLADEGNYEDEKPTAKHDETIVAKLTPSEYGDPHGSFPRYSMMGTDRTIQSFEIAIASNGDEEADEICTVWGCVAYTYEVDFTEDVTDDTILFNLYVKPSTLAHYLDLIRQEAITQAMLHVQRVDGFYSDWSPAISTDFIKVLTADKSHVIEIEPGQSDDFHRLGKVGEASLNLRKVISLPLPVAPSEPAYDEEEDHGPKPTPPTPELITARATLRIEQRLSALRVVLWAVVGLLTVLVARSVHIL